MNMETPLLAKKMANIDGYKPLFRAAYGKQKITLDKILNAIATFEVIIKSRQSRFDLFVEGQYKALTDGKAKDKSDSLYPKTDPILRPLHLTETEKHDLVAFLNAITATQYKMRRPELPQ